jgi:hypothetical protein
MLLIKNKVTGEKEQVGKLLLEILVRELHNDMLLPVNKGGFAGAIDERGVILDIFMRHIYLPVLVKCHYHFSHK